MSDSPAPRPMNGMVDGEASRTKRRDMVKAGVVVAGAVAAVYVKPSLTHLGIPAALAISGSPPTQQGCSPGYYKSGHPGSKYVPNQSFWSTFGLTPGTCGLPTSYTLQQAIDNPGGQAGTLAFQAAAAYVNAGRGINYPLTQDQVVSEVNAAFTANGGCDATSMSNEINRLNGFNNLEGPACS